MNSYQQRKSSGVCVDCGRVSAVAPSVKCDPCRAAHRRVAARSDVARGLSVDDRCWDPDNSSGDAPSVWAGIHQHLREEDAQARERLKRGIELEEYRELRSKHNKWNRAWCARQAAAGKCYSCSSAAEPGRTYCAKHRASNNKYARNSTLKRRARGQCLSCVRRVPQDKSRCEVHMAMMREVHRRYRARLATKQPAAAEA